jgi:ComF family protein
MVNSPLDRALNSLLPARCLLCELPSGRTLALCPDCEADLRPNRHACVQCGTPLPPDGVGAGGRPAAPRHCGACLQRPPPFQRTLAPWLYDERLGFLIQQWKYPPRQALAPLLVQLWLRRIPLPPTVDALVPVPLHWRRLLWRGFNQATLLAWELRRQAPGLAACPVLTRGIRRERRTSSQSRLGAGRRQRNLAHAFTVDRRCDNLRIAVVDDVMTTGATAAALAAGLQAAGAREVQLWCLARTPAPAGPESAQEENPLACPDAATATAGPRGRRR